jgi:hypothetical protein
MTIKLDCSNCNHSVEVPASGQPWSVPATLCAKCGALIGRVLLPQAPMKISDKRAFPWLPPLP